MSNMPQTPQTKQSQNSNNKRSNHTMETPVIESVRRNHPLLRSVAAIVVVAFSMLILSPAAAATRAEIERQQKEATTEAGVEQQLSRVVRQLEHRLTTIQRKLNAAENAQSDQQQLKPLQQQLKNLDRQVQQKFTRIEADLIAKGLPAKILERHQTMVGSYQAELATMLANLIAIEAATDDHSRQQGIEQALQHLQSKQQQRAQQPFDPNNLPNRSHKADPNNRPKQHQNEFLQAGLYNTPFIKLAALGDFSFDKLAGASDPAYLAETDEIILTQALQDKAVELNHDPIQIYRWVRNNIEWQPTWGSIQDAELVFETKRGNSMDISGLTIALLRASGIPARYVHGTIEIPEERYRNWAGGFSSIVAAADYAQSGGIPTTTVTTAGQIDRVQIEHIWVEAAIDYLPSRGAKNLDADSWVQLDPSYKQYMPNQAVYPPPQ